jgi:hypothetical protein
MKNWITNRRIERELYGKNQYSIGDIAKFYWRFGFMAAKWIGLALVLIAGCFFILKTILPHGTWIYGQDANGNSFDRRLVVANIIGLSITAIIGYKLNRKTNPPLESKQQDPPKNDKQFLNN